MNGIKRKAFTISALAVLAVMQPMQVFAESGSGEGTTLIPLREAAEAIGAKVDWDNENRQAIVSRAQVKLMVKIGEDTADINRTPTLMGGKAELVDSKTVIPLRAFQQAFHAKVNWKPLGGLTVEADDIQTRGSYFVHLLQSGQFAAAKEMMSDTLRLRLPEELLQMYWQGAASVFGEPAQLALVDQNKNAVHNNALLTYTTAGPMPFGIAVRFDSKGLVDEMYIPYNPISTYQKPDYDKPELYSEKEIVIGEGSQALPGTLTLPKGKGPFPVVVLVHGSGPEDRDETVGAYKPFRDLAVGLAANNVAVLRFEKRTMEYSLASALNQQFTVKEESVDDAIAAVKLLQKEPSIDPKRIYVVGHSQGGMLVPKILQQDTEKAIAGSVIMAGPAIPLEDVLDWQFKNALESAKKAGLPTEPYEQQVQMWEQLTAVIKDPQYSADHVPPGFAMRNQYWWFDFRNYHAPEIAKNQSGPLLILQGENDAQVSPNQIDDWKKALASRKDVSYKTYPKLNHFFVSSDKPSTGEEYVIPGNIPARVITDIADWVNKQ